MIGALIQTVIIAGLLGWSVLFMLKRFAPNLVRNRQNQFANLLSAKGWKTLAKWLEPTISSSGGCSSGCDTCGSCASNPHKTAEQPLHWKHSTPRNDSSCH